MYNGWVWINVRALVNRTDNIADQVYNGCNAVPVKTFPKSQPKEGVTFEVVSNQTVVQ